MAAEHEDLDALTQNDIAALPTSTESSGTAGPDNIGGLLASAWRATNRRDWPAALVSWEAVRAYDPDNPSGYIGGGNALRELGRSEASEMLLEAAAGRFPDNEQIAIARGWTANARRDWASALSRWEAVRAHYPNNPSGYLGAGSALREAGQLEAAAALLADAAERFPDNEQLVIARGWTANALCDWPAALGCWEAVRSRYPDRPAGYLGASAALRESGRLGEADILLDDAVKRFPDHEQIAIAWGQTANAARKWPEALRRWDAICARHPHNPWSHLGKVTALRGVGQTEEIDSLLRTTEAALSVAKQRGLDTLAALRVEFEIARTRFDWTAVRNCAEKIIAFGALPSAQVLLALSQACWHMGDLEAADRAASRALTADPTLSEAVLVRALVATNRGDGEEALACYRALVNLNPGSARWSLKLAQLLNWLGYIKEAVSEADGLRRRWPNDPTVRTFLRDFAPASAPSFDDTADTGQDDGEYAEDDDIRVLLNRAPGPSERLRPVIVANPEQDVLLGELSLSKTAVLVFTGSNDAVSIPLPIFDRYLATFDLTTVYLKDFKRLRYLLGVQSLGNDYQSTLAALREMLSRLGIKRVCAIGNCVGGFAAIRYGVELGADRIITFSSPTHCPDVAFNRLEQTQNFQRKRLIDNVPSDMIDLKPFLERSQSSSQIELFYDEEDPRERLHASHLADLPRIRLRPQIRLGNAHQLRRFALSNDDFRGMLAELLGLTERG